MRSLGHQPIISMVSHDFKVSWFSVIKKYNLRTSRKVTNKHFQMVLEHLWTYKYVQQ